MGAAKDLTIEAMKSKDEAKLKSILAALWHLSANSDDTKSEICEVNGALGFLLDMLDYEAPSMTRNVAENASGVLKNVSSHVATREEYRANLRDRDCVMVLLRHLKSQSTIMVNNICGILNNLSKHSSQDQQILCDSIHDTQTVPLLQKLARSENKVVSANAHVLLKSLLRMKNFNLSIVNFSPSKRDVNENRLKVEKGAGMYGSGQGYVVVGTQAVDNYKLPKSQEMRYIYPPADGSNRNEAGAQLKQGKSPVQLSGTFDVASWINFVLASTWRLSMPGC